MLALISDRRAPLLDQDRIFGKLHLLLTVALVAMCEKGCLVVQCDAFTQRTPALSLVPTAKTNTIFSKSIPSIIIQPLSLRVNFFEASTRILGYGGKEQSMQVRIQNYNTDEMDNQQQSPTLGTMEIQNDFWQKQKELVTEMKVKENNSRKEIARRKYEKRAIALLVDTTYFAFYIFCALWLFMSNPFVSFSYGVGAVCGIAYAYGLSKYVQSVGGTIDDAAEDVSGSGFGAARYAFLILLFVAVSKFRSTGFLEIPSILGFFTYQIASLSQGLREIHD